MRLFPIFLNLRGRPVLVVGGGTVAARKVQPLLAARAAVTIVAPALNSELAALEAANRLRHRAREFAATDIAGQWLVIAATDLPAVNAEVSAAAEAARVPCNVVDDRGLSSFIVPAVIDRERVQIAVSTGGASPVLARLIRERLESLLDHSLGTLAIFAERWRETARERFPDSGARRRFISWLLTGPAAAAIRAGRMDAADQHAHRALDLSGSTPGHVTLVGAGPGDPGLLTLKGLRALQEADVILHDRLISREVLDLARRDAERLDVGKRAGSTGTTQEQINAILVERARRGENVVRLKGGDPFVFGRGGEEIDHLRAHGISFEIVPGITAALAAGACAGIPLTDRREAQSLRLLTGNSDQLLARFDFSDLAAGRETLAFYMSVGTLNALRKRLLASGVGNETAVALVENTSVATQRVIVTTLDAMCRAASMENLQPPAIVLVGKVAARAASQSWFAHAAIAADAVA